MAANGVQENRLAQARQLIAQKNYNDAILILTTVVREEPDREDEAQELINEVMKLRNQYNSDYEKVIKLLYVDDDVDGALKVIQALEALDTNPNKQTIEEIKQAKRTARLKFNNKRYNDIMARALALLNRREYGAAVQVYLEGSDLAKDMFVEENYGSVLTDQVDRSWADLKAASALFTQAETRLKSLPQQGTALLASLQSTASALEPVLAPLRDLAGWRQRAWSDGQMFQSQNRFLVKNGRQEDFYLSYSSLFINGPPDAAQPQGILGAIDRLWAESLDPWTTQVRTDVEVRYAAAKLAFDQGRYAEAKIAFEGLRVKARQGIDLLTLWNRIAGVDATGALDAAFRVKLTQALPLGVWLEHRLTLAVEGLKASDDIPRAASLAASGTLDRAGLESARADVGAQKTTFDAYSQTAASWPRQAQGLTAAGFTLTDPNSFATGWQAVWTGFRQKALQQESGFVDRRGGLDFGLLDGRFQALQTALTATREQVEGNVRYPLQALAKLNDLRPNQDALSKDISSFVTLYDGEAPEVKTAAVQQWPVKGRDLLNRLTAAQTLQGQLLATAQANYTQSQTLKKQGQDLLASITAATNAENFTKARTDLNTMSARYSDSLKLQEDAAFRADSDAQVKSLFDLILAAENVVVVREVRKLITDGSEAYLAQQFRQSEQLLLKAQKRWADTNQVSNPEVDYWLGLASMALSVTTGRELSPIDPLYVEVQQMLNFSRRDFNLGKDKLAAGDKDAGLQLMSQATTTLGKILLTSPQNQEAGLLKLEILKASDPDNFPTVFKQNFDIAVAKINTGDPRAAYTDLQDLDKIQPGYPAMAAAIRQVRIKLNLEKAPVDPALTAEARRLLAQATRLFAGGSQAQLTEARTLLRRVLDIEPKNTDAQELVDKISVRAAVLVATLTPSQVGELNDIVDLLRDQRTLEAKAQISDFIAKNPAVANDPRVQAVKRRVEAVN